MGGVWSTTEGIKSSTSTPQADDTLATSNQQSPDQRRSQDHHSVGASINPSLYQQRDKRPYHSMDALNDTHMNEDSSHQHSRTYWSRKGPQHTQRCWSLYNCRHWYPYSRSSFRCIRFIFCRSRDLFVHSFTHMHHHHHLTAELVVSNIPFFRYCFCCSCKHYLIGDSRKPGLVEIKKIVDQIRWTCTRWQLSYVKPWLQHCLLIASIEMHKWMETRAWE